MLLFVGDRNYLPTFRNMHKTNEVTKGVGARTDTAVWGGQRRDLDTEGIPREYLQRLLGKGRLLEMKWPPSGPWQTASDTNADQFGP